MSVGLSPASRTGRDETLAVLNAQPQQVTLALGERAKVELRRADLEVQRPEAIGFSQMRDVDRPVAVRAVSCAFHSGTNSSKQDGRNRPRTVLSFVNPMNSGLFCWCCPCS